MGQGQNPLKIDPESFAKPALPEEVCSTAEPKRDPRGPKRTACGGAPRGAAAPRGIVFWRIKIVFGQIWLFLDQVWLFWGLFWLIFKELREIPLKSLIWLFYCLFGYFKLVGLLYYNIII